MSEAGGVLYAFLAVQQLKKDSPLEIVHQLLDMKLGSFASAF
jgi:hypothetical protein